MFQFHIGKVMTFHGQVMDTKILTIYFVADLLYNQKLQVGFAQNQTGIKGKANIFVILILSTVIDILTIIPFMLNILLC